MPEARADAHKMPPDLLEWCQANAAQTAVCAVGLAVVLPVVVLEEAGQAFQDRCEGAGGVYTPEPSEDWPHRLAYAGQWTCEGGRS